MHRIYKMSVSDVYPHYVTKAVRKGRSQKEVNELICWLTGYTEIDLQKIIDHKITFQDFFENAPTLNPLRHEIKGKICGVQIEEIEDPLMKEIRYLDKIIDELAKGKSIEKITHRA